MPIAGGKVDISGEDHGLLSGLTPDDDHTQYLHLPGRTGVNPGQVIGSGIHTGGNPTDLVLEGRVIMGDATSGVNFTTGRVFQIRGLLLTNSIFSGFSPDLSGLTGVASGAVTMFQVSPTNSLGFTSGTISQFRGFVYIPAFTIPAGVTFTEVVGGVISSYHYK